MLRLTIRKDLQSLIRLNTLVIPFLDRHQVPGRETYAVRLVVEELLTNCIKFTRQAPYSDDVGFLLEVGADQILIRLEYEGPDFDPRDAPLPDVDLPLAERPLGGLGLYLIQNMVDDLEYTRIDGRSRVDVRIGTRPGA
jgi:anti-sigma regulatory factor (Ser/Thr protein kinase)